MSKLTYEYIKQYIEDNNCKLLSKDYIDNSHLLDIQCACGTVFKRNFNNFKHKKKQCTVCSNNYAPSYEEVKKYIEQHNCKLISKEYKSANTDIEIQCKCGNIFKRRFSVFKKSKKQCQKCSGTEKLSIEYVKKYIETYSDCKFLSKEYKDNKKKLKFQCKCGEIFYRGFTEFKNNKKECTKCAGGVKLSYEYVKKYVESCGCELLSKEYKNSATNLKLKCNCGRIFYRRLGNLQNNSKKCKFCIENEIESLGEMEIKNFLIKNNINYEPEFRFNNCKDKKPLPFDFAIFNDSNKIKTMIEYDGKQHFKPYYFFGGEERFKTTQLHDKIKNEYCKNNNVPLLRISYKNFKNIDNILEEKLINK